MTQRNFLLKQKMTKTLIFDSSAIITFALNDLLSYINPLKEKFNGSFTITRSVQEEIINRPSKILRFMLEALQIKKFADAGIIEIFQKDIRKETDKILEIANHTFRAGDEWIKIVHDGEASCIALYNLLNEEKKAIVIDERTTRMLCEAPENLHKLLERKLKTKIQAIEKNYEFFRGIKIIRSSELIYMAYISNIITLPIEKKEAIKALLYGAKFKGCAISDKEIREAQTL